MMTMQTPANINVELNIRAAKVVRSPNWEKLLLYQYGSSDINPAMLTPETTKNGNKDAMVFAFMSSACTNVT